MIDHLKRVLLASLTVLFLSFPAASAQANIYQQLQTPFYDPNSTGGSGGDQCSPDLIGSENKAKIWYYFTVIRGLSAVQTAGIMGNIQSESAGTWDPRVVQGDPPTFSDTITVDGKTGYGIAQWTSAGRQQGLLDFAKARGLPEYNLGVQLDYLWYELENSYPTVLVDLRATNDLATATYIVLERFEAPTDIEGNKPFRLGYATEILAEPGSGARDTGGSGSVTCVGNPSTTAGASILGNVGDNSDSVACASGTKNLGTVNNTYNGALKTSSATYVVMRLCEISNLPASPGNLNQDKSGNKTLSYATLNSRVSGAIYAMVEAAKQAGVNLSSNSSFRAVQTCTGGSDSCGSQGSSYHQLGIAVDFGDASDNGYKAGDGTCLKGDPNVGRQTASSKTYKWLRQNASKFGFKQYCNESWHWDASNDPYRIP